MEGLIGIGFILIASVTLLRALFAPGAPQPAQPQIIYVQQLPPQSQQEGGGFGCLVLLLLAVLAAVMLFPA
jgi:hypothetical protein